MRKSLVVKFHDLMGHFAVDRTVNKIKEFYWFPLMKRYVRRHVARCVECLFNKIPGGKQQGFLHPIKPGKRPFSIVHMDHVGPFVRSTRGNQELLVIVDNLTRFVRLSPVRNTSTQNVLKVMKSFVNDFGLPDKIISDRGSCFTSRQFEEFCRGNGIHHTLNSTKHPQVNGMVERVNRTVLSTIATGIEDPRRKDWDLKIKEVERDLNNAVNKTTNKTLFETLHGYSPRFHDGILRRLADEDMDPWTEPERIQESVRTQIENKQEIMKTYYDKKKCRTLQFEVGEIVVMRHVPKMTGEPTKAQPKYRGPLIITEVLPSDTYRVTQLSERTGGRFYTTTAHISQLKYWHSEEDDSATEESPDEESEEEDTLRRNPRQIHPKLTKVYGNSDPSISTVKQWTAEFKRGRTSFEYDPREGRPKTATPLETIKKVHNIVLDDRRVKMDEIAEAKEATTQVGSFFVQHLPRNPSLFSGEGIEDPHNWLKEYERVPKHNQWDETLCLANVYFYLTGTALKWSENNEESILTGRSSCPSEITEFYIQDVLRLCKEVDPHMNEEDKIYHLMKGIAEELYQAHTTEQFVTECRRIEALHCKRVTPTRYVRLPNVAFLSDHDDREDLSSMIRQIVREEIQPVASPFPSGKLEDASYFGERKMTRALIDSGASYSVISERFRLKLRK
ncbi:hypothetical protein LAZ67_21001454 [Cordylochernes scorpioides]|uniref:RNA-directed DNA polymerase n=1 Tax=Cordylochernes scorpioides TaxID=51811 RepID=A0ABY6LPL5_9ARAC|nr:hypothetical protein LAZ67_21001454 [Cordylochernes scorpioides]